MKLKRFRGSDSAKILKLIKDTFGPEAVILSSHSVGDEIEVVAAIDFDESVLSNKIEASEGYVDEPLTLSSSDKVNEEGDFKKVESEVKLLREMIESQLASLTWSSISNHNPVQVIILKQLLRIGFDIETAERLVSSIKPKMTEPEAWGTVKKYLVDNLTFCDEDLIETGGTFFFIGPTGVGKTTTIAKIAARFCLKYGAENCGLITLDNYRIAAFEQLLTYGKILGVNVSTAEDVDSLNLVMKKLSDKKIILIDSSGFNPKSHALKDLMRLVTQCDYPIETIMVLSATSQTHLLEDALNAYRQLESKRVILTKTDESYIIANALCALIKANIPLLYLTNGQRVPEDIMRATQYQIFKLLNHSLLNVKEDENKALKALVSALMQGETHA